MSKHKKHNLPVILALLGLVTTPAFGQNEDEYLMEIGVSGGISSSVNDANVYEYFDGAFGALIRYRFNNRVAIRGEWYLTNVSGNYLVENNKVDFDNRINNIQVCGEFNFFDLTQDPYKRNGKKFSPYIFAGFGVNGFGYEGTATVRPSVSFGVGVKLKLTHRLNLNIQFDNQLLMSDRLESVAVLNDARNNGSNFLNNDLLSSLKLAITFDFLKKPCNCNDVSR
ncbi:MAG: porin family protein [Prevotellaceae bacterium]|nr:porin family protein [Prevotellaceae bacterium]